MDEFGPLNLQPHPGRQWGTRGGGGVRPRPPAAGDLHLSAWGAALAGGLWPLPRPAVWAHQAPQTGRGVPWCSCAMCAPCTRPGCGWGSCWTTSVRTCPPAPTAGSQTGQRPTTSSWPTCRQRFLAEPDRGAVPGAALFHLGRHRPRQPPRAGQHDSPLHRLAKPNVNDQQLRQIVNRAKVARRVTRSTTASACGGRLTCNSSSMPTRWRRRSPGRRRWSWSGRQFQSSDAGWPARRSSWPPARGRPATTAGG